MVLGAGDVWESGRSSGVRAEGVVSVYIRCLRVAGLSGSQTHALPVATVEIEANSASEGRALAPLRKVQEILEAVE